MPVLCMTDVLTHGAACSCSHNTLSVDCVMLVCAKATAARLLVAALHALSSAPPRCTYPKHGVQATRVKQAAGRYRWRGCGLHAAAARTSPPPSRAH